MFMSFIIFENHSSLLAVSYYIYFRYADQVAIGDEVLVQGNDGFTPQRVFNVSYSMMQGDNNFCLLSLFVFLVHR